MRVDYRWSAPVWAPGLSFSAGLACPAQAQIKPLGKYSALVEQHHHDPADKPKRLDFAEIETEMATDPLTGSADPGRQLHRTPELGPELGLTQTTDILRQAIPVGAPASGAASLLRRAGAYCGKATDSQLDSQLVCHYRDAETPCSGAVSGYHAGYACRGHTRLDATLSRLGTQSDKA